VRDRAITILKVLLSIFLVVLAFSKVDMSQVATQLASANPWYFLAALALYLLAVVVNGVKWQILLRAQDMRVPFRAVLQFLFIGFFFNNFLPANVGGDVMRGYGLARYTDRSADAAVSVIVDRIIGLMAYMSSAVVAALVAVRLSDRPEWRRLEWIAIVALAALGMAFAVMLSRRFRSLVSAVFALRWFAPAAPIWGKLSDAFNAYRFQYGALVAAYGVGIVGIFCTALVNWCLSLSMGGLMPLSVIFLVNPLIALVLMLPISIGGLGVTQAIYPFLYSLAGVPAGHALAVSLMMQLIVFLGSLPGAVLWVRGEATRRRATSVAADGEEATGQGMGTLAADGQEQGRL
jgi:uncharacterized protein (TIRG00374 family)